MTTHYDDMIDTRDLIELVNERQELVDALADATESGDADAIASAAEELASWDDEYAGVIAFASECEDSFSDYPYGETLIRDSYFREYASDLADDIGAVPADAKWPLTCIDWGQAARELQMDYTAVTFNGVTYWGRS